MKLQNFKNWDSGKNGANNKIAGTIKVCAVKDFQFCGETNSIKKKIELEKKNKKMAY